MLISRNEPLQCPRGLRGQFHINGETGVYSENELGDKGLQSTYGASQLVLHVYANYGNVWPIAPCIATHTRGREKWVSDQSKGGTGVI